MLLTEHCTTGSTGEYTRDLWLMTAPTQETHRLCVFLDAEHYLRDMNCLPVISELMQNGLIPPVTCVFISHVSGEDRQRDYLWNERYARFIAEDVVAWCTEQANIQATDNVMCGLSLSGLAGAQIALLYPERFPDVLCQSGSFWWLAQQELSLPKTSAKFWLSVGDEETETGVSHAPLGLFQEVSQIAGVEWAASRLQSLGATVKYRQYAGGHAIAPWREELPLALTWLLGSTKIDE